MHTTCGGPAQGVAYTACQFGIIVVADPGVEQIAEDKQAVARLGVGGDEVLEQGEGLRTLDCQVKIGDEPLLFHGRGL